MLREWRRWLHPGMSVKRWFALVGLGVTISSLALAMGLAWLYRTIAFPDAITTPVRNVTLQFVAHPWRESPPRRRCTAPSAPVSTGSAFRWFKPLMEMIDSDLPLIDLLQQKRDTPAEPEMINVVSIGGGTGLSTLLRGL